jgi:hypothetical protein
MQQLVHVVLFSLLSVGRAEMELRINSASIWFLLHRCFGMQGQQNIKKNTPCLTGTPLYNPKIAMT